MHSPRSKQANKYRAVEARVVHMQGTSNRSAYFPRGLWFSPYDGAPAVDATEGGRYVSVSVRTCHSLSSNFTRVPARQHCISIAISCTAGNCEIL